MSARNPTLCLCFALMLGLPGVVGCSLLRPRPEEGVAVQNLVFHTEKMLPEIALGESEERSMVLYHRSERQGVYILQIASDATLGPQYNSRQDMVLLCVGGSGVVEIEGTRYVVRPRSAVFVPRHATYRIVPGESGEDFAALVVFSPPYRPGDAVEVEEE